MKKTGRILSSVCMVLLCLFSLCGLFPVVSSADDDDAPASLFVPNLEDGRMFTQNGESYTVFPAAVFIDLNGDGACSTADVREMLRIVSRLSTYEGEIAAADMSGDGALTVEDARMLLRYVACLDTYYTDNAGTVVLKGFAQDPEGHTFYLNSHGCLAVGLQVIDGATYYIQSDTGIYKGLKTIGNKLYDFGEDGKGVNGAATIDGKTYFFENGKALTGWRQDGDDFYYYNEDGTMALGEQIIDGLIYTFGADGKSETGKEGTVPRDPSTYKIAMIGDSLVATIDAYNVTDRIDLYGKVSLHADTIFTKKESGSSRYIIDEVKDRGYDVVIIMVGINDLGYSDSGWGEQYRAIIQGVKARAPEAIIYAHAILPVNESVARRNGYSCTNAQVNGKNAVIQRVAKEEGVRYIDAGTIFRTSSGELPADAASDGIHLTRSNCAKWSDWLVKTVCQ